MRYLDMESWDRKDHYTYFKGLTYPHFSIGANVDITAFYRSMKEKGNPFFISFLYVAMRAANEVAEFRYRIRGDKVVEHDTVRPSFTTMTDKGVFSFCTVPYMPDYSEFRQNTERQIDDTRDQVVLSDEPGRDDLVFVTSIPWVSFTSITQPIQMDPVDCIPRISWGKFFEEGGRAKLPLSVQAHHSLVDGDHIGRYFIKIQELLDYPERYFE